MKEFLISPPFGNWIGHKACTRVRGSFTLNRRRGLLYHTLRTLRPVRGGYINQIGLRNCGIKHVPYHADCIYSLVGLETDDWLAMRECLPVGATVEVNLGCPNVHRYGIDFHTLMLYAHRFHVIAKLPPTEAVDAMAAMCVEAGVTYLHLSNTIPTIKGGISGRPLFERNLPIVQRIATRYPLTTVIAGGGIYDRQTVERYRDAGATRFSLATVWFTPWKVPAIIR